MAGQSTKPLGIGIRRRSAEQRLQDSRKGGSIAGAKVYRERLGLFAMSPEEKSAAGRKGGKIGGATTALIPGHMKYAGSLGGPKGGKTQGDINAANGHLDYARHVRHHIRDGKVAIKFCRFCNPTLQPQ